MLWEWLIPQKCEKDIPISITRLVTILIFVTSYCFQFYLLAICKIPFTFAQRELFDICKAQRIGAVVMSLNRYQQFLTSLLTSVTQIDTIFFIILRKDSKIPAKNEDNAQ